MVYYINFKATTGIPSIPTTGTPGTAGTGQQTPPLSGGGAPTGPGTAGTGQQTPPAQPGSGAVGSQPITTTHFLFDVHKKIQHNLATFDANIEPDIKQKIDELTSTITPYVNKYNTIQFLCIFWFFVYQSIGHHIANKNNPINTKKDIVKEIQSIISEKSDLYQLQQIIGPNTSNLNLSSVLSALSNIILIAIAKENTKINDVSTEFAQMLTQTFLMVEPQDQTKLTEYKDSFFKAITNTIDNISSIDENTEITCNTLKRQMADNLQKIKKPDNISNTTIYLFILNLILSSYIVYCSFSSDTGFSMNM